ncbi:MAG: 2-octaprenyl-6-methoxyphenyl hydroxylase [Vibrio sp.]
MKKYDIAIVGSGMAGATLALAIDRLCKGKLKIAVIEAQQMDEQSSHPGFDSRAIALSYGTIQILKQLDLWSLFEPIATPITDIEISDQGHLGLAEITAKQELVDALGVVVELETVGRIYQNQIQQCAAIDYICPAKVEQIKRTVDSVSISLSNEVQLEVNLLVAADGALSETCQQIGIALKEIDFEQYAVIANVKTDIEPQGRAYERFTQFGPLAFLPMSEGRSSVVWCMPKARMEQVLQADESQLIEQLQQDFGWRLGKIQRIGSLASYPLILRYRESVVSHRCVVIGNAAQTLHPIAGQGFNLGIRDVMSLAEEIAHTCQSQEQESDLPESKQPDIGSYSLLTRYKQRREQDREQTMALTSNLVTIFSNHLPAMRVGRNLGLLAISHFPFIKCPLVKRTMGLVKR